MPEQVARCVDCRSEVSVPDSYAHGDHIKCGACGTQHKVQRGDALRLVIADVAPLRDALQDNRRRIANLEVELRAARASFGVGANGFGVGVIFFLYEVGHNDLPWSTRLVWAAVGVAVASGIVLEMANYLFLAKRKQITALSAEIAALVDEGRQLQQKIREASRV